MSDSFKSSIASLRVANASAPSKGTIAVPHASVPVPVIFALPLSPPQSFKENCSTVASLNEVKEPKEDYDGAYAFAPIKEHVVSRAMTKRYAESMMGTAISDVVIIGAGSAGLSCAYTLANAVSRTPATLRGLGGWRLWAGQVDPGCRLGSRCPSFTVADPAAPWP